MTSSKHNTHKGARIIHTASSPNGQSVVIRRNSDWNEYIVQFFSRDAEGIEVYLHLADYTTTNRGDAFHAAHAHLNKEYA